MEEKTYKGLITYYSPEKHFGFIDSHAGEGIFFFYDTTRFKNLPANERKGKRSFFLKGDEVDFKLRATEKRIEAYDLQLIKNEKAEQLLSLINENELLPGYLKKINDAYYVKDKATYLFLPVAISTWETDLEEVYEQRLNQLVHYLTPDTATKIEKVKITLSDRKLSVTHSLLKKYLDTQETLTATVTGKTKDGYHMTLLNGEIPAFLFFKKNEIVPHFEKRQQVLVFIKKLYERGMKIQLADRVSN